MDEKQDKPDEQAAESPESIEEGKPGFPTISKEKLKQTLEEHEKWLESKGEEEGKQADLRGANLQEANLKGANLQEAKLGATDLQKADLWQANLQKADLRGANLQKANLYEANLQEANLGATNLQEAILPGADLQKADLGSTNFQQAILREAKLQEASLRYANLLEADLEGANLQEAKLGDTNLQKAKLGYANLQKAYLGYAKLQKAYLGYAKLQKAYLGYAKLQKANLEKANLSEAILTDADLTKTNLNRANLQKVDFTGAKGLSDANLKDADLTEAKGLLGSEFASKDITGSRLPKDLHEFKTLQIVEETSKNARKIFFAMLLGCVYSWLTIATTTDVRLLTNSASSPLPIIGTEIPIAWFYWAAPFVLLGLYLYFHFYLDNLWESLSGLPARFPDGKRLDQRAYPWLLNCIVCRHFTLLEDRPRLAYMKEWATIFLAWWAVPLTFIGFWLRYLPRHEWAGTCLHIALIIFSITSSIMFYSLTANTLRGEKDERSVSKTNRNDKKNYIILTICLIGFVLGIISHGAINGIRWKDRKAYDINPIDVRLLVPLAFEMLGYSPFANFREQDVSIKPNDYYKIEDDKKRVESVKGANLKGRNLTQADMVFTFLVKADLRGANLQGANLIFADLTACKNLTQEQLDSACGNEKTKLPPGLTIKKCPEKKE